MVVEDKPTEFSCTWHTTLLLTIQEKLRKLYNAFLLYIITPTSYGSIIYVVAEIHIMLWLPLEHCCFECHLTVITDGEG